MNFAKNSINVGKLLEFEVVFPNEEMKTPQEYLKGGSQKIILKVAAFFLGFKPHNSKYANNKELLGSIFSEPNRQFATDVYQHIKVSEDKGEVVSIINAYSSLKLFEIFFEFGDAEEIQTSEEFERNLFKAYLAINSSLTKLQLTAFNSSNRVDDILKPAAIFFSSQFPLGDKSSFDLSEIWATQIIKASYFFEFLETHPKAKVLLEKFLKRFEVANWQEYLKKLIPLTVTILTAEREAHTDITVPFGESFDSDCAFLEKLVVLEPGEFEEDFITLRTKPFYKIDNGRYRVIFNLFVVEKVFKGLYFILKEVNDKLSRDTRIAELKSFIGNEFSEKFLFYKVIESIFIGRMVKLSGSDFERLKIDGGPDYYIRSSNNIFLFESKDFLIKACKKQSFDYNVYEDELERILYFENTDKGKQKHKGIMQLINSIRKILQKKYSSDTDYSFRHVKIYPILVVHDQQYNIPGFNALLEYWFRAELELLQKEGLYVSRVQSLTVINIDSLIYHQLGLASKCTLKEVIDLYNKNSKKKIVGKFRNEGEVRKEVMEKYIPFSIFIEKIFKHKGIYQPPPLVEIIAPTLFKGEINN